MGQYMITTDTKIEKKSDNFLKIVQEHLPQIEVISDKDSETYKDNTLGAKRSIQGVVRPKNQDEVINLVNTANLTKTPLYPISCGKNWGFGSKLPVTNGCIIVDLSKMNKILEVNTNFGYIVVEPGVTQMQVYKHLQELKCSYFLDVTGSSGDSSVLGNSLEKGIAYNSERADHVSAMTTVLGNGEVLKTGYGHIEESKITHHSKYGIGPSLDGLFLQSNFGIVTSACIDLLPKHEDAQAFYISIDEPYLHDTIERFRPLLQKNILNCIPHIGNRQRFFLAARPLLRQRMKDLGIYKNDLQIDSTLKKAFPSEWSAIGSIQGIKKQVKITQHELSKAMKGLANVKFMSDSKYRRLRSIAKFLRLKNIQALLEATQPFHGLAKGKPTYDTLPSLFEASGVLPSEANKKEPDHSNAGFYYTVPFAPMTGQSSKDLLDITRKIGHMYGFHPGITFNLVNKKTLEAVISLEFDKSDLERTNKAKFCIREMIKTFMEKGVCPYRFDNENMDLAIDETSNYWQTVKRLKSVFDPNHIISPKRYNTI